MRRAAGFTLVEVLVAIVLLTAGLLGLMATAAVTTRLVADGRRDARVAALAAARLEILRSLRCGALGTGATADGPYRVTWTAEPAPEGVRATVVVTGPTAAHPADTLVGLIPC